MKIINCDNGNVMMSLKEVVDISDKIIPANSVDAVFEKHVPQYEIMGEKVKIYVNHVMEKEHYIEWILVDYGNMQIIKHFNPGDDPFIEVEYKDSMKAYSYCNKHSLWMNEKIS